MPEISLTGRCQVSFSCSEPSSPPAACAKMRRASDGFCRLWLAISLREVPFPGEGPAAADGGEVAELMLWLERVGDLFLWRLLRTVRRYCEKSPPLREPASSHLAPSRTHLAHGGLPASPKDSLSPRVSMGDVRVGLVSQIAAGLAGPAADTRPVQSLAGP